MTALVMPCENAVTECAVPTSPLLGFNSETPDVLSPPRPASQWQWQPQTWQPATYSPTYTGNGQDVFFGDLGIDGDWPIL
jgi:hypothetical protein